MSVLKKRFSFVDVVLYTVLLSVALFATLTWGRGQAPEPPRLGDPRAVTLMRGAYDAAVARRDVRLSPEKQDELARLFHNLEIWRYMWYMGVRIQKNPCDLWMMQQIIYETRPDYIIETGTFRGGSALYFAHMLEGIGLDSSQVITIDIKNLCQEAAKLPLWQKRVEFIEGSSIDPDVVARITDKVKGKKVIVVLDSVHTRDHVLQELRHYGPLVGPGSYLIAEDTNLDGVIAPDFLGPLAAVQEFLESPQGRDYTQDVSREALVLTFNPGGWLKKTESVSHP